jgi:hypothetical protein
MLDKTNERNQLLKNRIDAYKEFINLLVQNIIEFLLSIEDETLSPNCQHDRDDLLLVLTPYIENKF